MSENTSKPSHIAFIMDGNRRWAVSAGLEKMEGHTKGLEVFNEIVKHCAEIGITNITFWALSTENIKKRDQAELEHLFKLLGQLRDHLKDMVNYDAKLEYIGDLSKLPSWLRTILNDVKEKTKDHKKLTVTLGINYGGHDEIIRMAKNIASSTETASQVSEKVIGTNIDTGILPEVDLIIRTGGHKRLSGFLPWISDYAELYFTDKMWPEFNSADLDEAIDWYSKQQRNFGK